MFVWSNANSRVRHDELNVRADSVARQTRRPDVDFTFFRKFDRIAGKINQDLTQAGWITVQCARDTSFSSPGEVETLLHGTEAQRSQFLFDAVLERNS